MHDIFKPHVLSWHGMTVTTRNLVLVDSSDGSESSRNDGDGREPFQIEGAARLSVDVNRGRVAPVVSAAAVDRTVRRNAVAADSGLRSSHRRRRRLVLARRRSMD